MGMKRAFGVAKGASICGRMLDRTNVQAPDAELERVRQLEIEQLLRPVLLASDALLLAALALAAPVYPLDQLLLGGAALACAALNLWAVGRRMARSSEPSRWVLFHEMLIAVMVALTVGLSGGWESPAVPLAATVAVVMSARLQGWQLGVALAALVVGLAAAGEFAAPAPDGLGPARVLAWMSVLVGIAGSTTRLAHAERSARGTAVLDPLTGLLNRQALEWRLEELASQVRVTGQPVSAVVCDLDGFKSVNDTRGHAAGDRVLEEATYTMRTSLRRFELLYRFGGDEFVVLLPGAGADEARAVAERLRTAVAVARPAGAPVTVSAGVATVAGYDADLRELFRAADGALYDAKAAGRNCVRMAQVTDRAKAAA